MSADRLKRRASVGKLPVALVGKAWRVHGIMEEIFATAETMGFVDLGPYTDLWSRNGLLQPEMPPAFRPKRFRNEYAKAPFWLTFVGGRAAIPMQWRDHSMLIRMVRQADLGWAAQGGHTLIARALIELGEDINDADSDGYTPLHWAVSGEEPEMARLLLEHGADPNYPDELGRTPLHLAALEGMTEFAMLLLCGGADPNIEDDEGANPRDAARQAGNDGLAMLLGKVVAQQQARALSLATVPVASAGLPEISSVSARRL